jgi:hypothetical protein
MLTRCCSIHQKVDSQIDKFAERNQKISSIFNIWNILCLNVNNFSWDELRAGANKL